MSAALVTGATTPVGAAVVRALLEGAVTEHVLAVGAESPAVARPLLPAERVTYLQADLTRSRDLRQLLFAPARALGVELVVHTAQHRSARRAGSKVHALNVDSTRELLHLCEGHPTIRHLIHRSCAEVYAVRADQPTLIDEHHPLDFSPAAPQWLRDRIEADLTVCSAAGLSPLRITVLRCAECLAPGTGSQLYDYLQSRVCFQPLGYDPMLNLLSLPDLARAVRCAARARQPGIFNIPGKDTLPLSAAIDRWGRTGVPVPALLLDPLYRLRTRALGSEFRYDLNSWRFHYSGVLDGRRAREVLGYVPRTGLCWPR